MRYNLFQIDDISLESQWRSIILFGKNSATYKFAFARCLLDFAEKQQTTVSLEELSKPFANHIVEHLKMNSRQGSSRTSTFLNSCRDYISGDLNIDELSNITEKYGFVNVVDAFQIVNRSEIPNPFYYKDYKGKSKKIVITDELLKLKESVQFINLEQEVEARWNLVETAWNLKINPALLEVKHDPNKGLIYIESQELRRKDITSVKDALNGYQKGKCFYSFKDISIRSGDYNICDVDHFLPHKHKKEHLEQGANLDGIWNLVLADQRINRQKSDLVPDEKFLTRLYNRNEFYIVSKHPLAETIINQTGSTKEKRRSFLQKHYNISKGNSIHTWRPDEELTGNF